MTLFADETYALLAPLEDVDSQNGYALRALVRAVASMYAQPEEAIRALGDGKAAWERVFDPDRAPAWLLPFVGQAVGVVVNEAFSTAEQIAQIKAEGGWHRGTPATIVAALKQGLYSAINFVPNPGFEHGSGGWASSGSFLTSGATATVITGSGHSGTHFMEVTTGAVAKRGIEANVPGTFINNTHYTLSAWVKGNAGGEKIVIGMGNSATAEETFSTEKTLTTEWERISVTLGGFATTVVDTLEIFLRAPGATGIGFKVDDVQLEYGLAPTTYNDGDSPGWTWTGAFGQSASANVSTPPLSRMRMVERSGSAWTLLIVASPGEVVSLAKLRALAQSVTPGGIVVTVEVSDLPLIDEGAREIDLATTDTIDTATLADVT